MKCAACHEEFETARRAEDGKLAAFEADMICVCVLCGTILYVVSPGESRIADHATDDIPQTAYTIAYNILYGPDTQQQQVGE
jgi:hypothetical protein